MEFNNLIQSFSENKTIIALLYIVLSFLLAFIIDKVFFRFLRSLVARSNSDLDDTILEFLHKPLYYSILFFGFTISTNVFK